MPMATIYDVAREAGVSISSVSNALHGKNKVSEKTRIKIEQAIEKLGYSVDPAASSLKSNSTKVIGLIVPSIDSAFFPSVISGLQGVLEESGYIINFYSTNFSFDMEQKYVRTLLDYRVDGIIIDSVATNTRFLSSLANLKCRSKRVPVIAIERDLTEIGITSVFADNKKGGRMAAEHLLSMNVKRAAHIYGKHSAPWSQDRLEGFREVYKEAGIEVPYWRIADGEFTIRGGKDAANKLLENGKIDGIFASNDLSAVGAMQALKSKGYDIPSDIKIIGYDNTYVTSLTAPTLSTVEIPKTELGANAGKAVLCAIEAHDKPEVEKIELPPKLIPRESTVGCDE